MFAGFWSIDFYSLACTLIWDKKLVFKATHNNNRNKKIIAIIEMQRRIQNSVKHLNWSVLQKQLTTKSC